MEVQPGIATAGPKNRRGDRQSIGHQTGSGPTTGWRIDVAKPLPYTLAGVRYKDLVPVDGDRNIALTWQTTEADTIAANIRYFDSEAARWKIFSVMQKATLPAIGTARLYVIQEARWADLAGTLDVLPIEYMAAPNTWRPAQVLGGCVPFVRGRQVVTLVSDSPLLAGTHGGPTALGYHNGSVYWARPGAAFRIDPQAGTGHSPTSLVIGTGIVNPAVPAASESALGGGTIANVNQFFWRPDNTLYLAEFGGATGATANRDQFLLPYTGPFVPGQASSIVYGTPPYYQRDAIRILNAAGDTLTKQPVAFTIPHWSVGGPFRAVYPVGCVVAPDGTAFLALNIVSLGQLTPFTASAYVMYVLLRVSGGSATVVRYTTTSAQPGGSIGKTTWSDAAGDFVPGVGLLLEPDGTGVLYANVAQQIIERIDVATGAVTIAAGVPIAPGTIYTGDNGDGGPATAAHLDVYSVFGTDKFYYINGAGTVRRVLYATGQISTVWGGPGFHGDPVDGGLVARTATPGFGPSCCDPCGNIYFTYDSQLWRAGCPQPCRSTT